MNVSGETALHLTSFIEMWYIGIGCKHGSSRILIPLAKSKMPFILHVSAPSITYEKRIRQRYRILQRKTRKRKSSTCSFMSCVLLSKHSPASMRSLRMPSISYKAVVIVEEKMPPTVGHQRFWRTIATDGIHQDGQIIPLVLGRKMADERTMREKFSKMVIT